MRPRRFALGLAVGAVFAHLGWGVLHWDVLRRAPWAWLDPAGGYCVLFVPLGVLLATPSAAAVRALPLAFVVARVGCLAAGCCHGPEGEPTPAFEMLGFGALHAVLLRLCDRWAIPAFCTGFACVRLAAEPWRSAAPLGEPVLAPAWLAAAWLAAGVALAVCAQKRKPY